MEADFPHNDILQMIELFVPLKLDMKAILNTDLHFHWSDLGLFDFIVWDEDGKVDLFG